MQIFNTQQITLQLILFIAFAVVVLFQLWYYLGVFGRLVFYKKKEAEAPVVPVSVIICARNEEKKLAELLPFILKQDYPQYEVVVVNDCSYDYSADVLEEFSKKHDHLKIVTIKEDEHHFHGKKFALLVGIKGARYEHLLMTDADCKPDSDQWIKNMMSNFSTGTEVVLGYGAYEKLPGFLNKLIRFDTFYAALQYLSFGIAGKPYMGVGRNLAYTKSLFFNNKGFATHYHIESGDDDLFINEVATGKNTKVEVRTESRTTSIVKKTLKTWMQQKRRHITTFPKYNSASRMRLLSVAYSQYLFWALFITLLIMQVELYVITGIFFFRLLVQMFIFRKAMIKLGEKDLWWWSTILELAHMFFYPMLAVSNMFVRKSKWKI